MKACSRHGFSNLIEVSSTLNGSNQMSKRRYFQTSNVWTLLWTDVDSKILILRVFFAAVLLHPTPREDQLGCISNSGPSRSFFVIIPPALGAGICLEMEVLFLEHGDSSEVFISRTQVAQNDSNRFHFQLRQSQTRRVYSQNFPDGPTSIQNSHIHCQNTKTAIH